MKCAQPRFISKISNISEVKSGKYFLISTSLSNSNSQYSFVYCGKLDRMMDVWRKIEKTIILFSFASSLLLSALLAWLLNRRSKPLTQLINHVNNVKNGIYDTRVEIRSKDEFSILGNNFNEMSGKIRANMEQLNNDMKNKQQFIDNLSHELRTPLTSIHGYAEYIQKAAISEEDKYEATLCIMEESKRLQYMSARMLDISLLRQASINKTEINVDELFRKILKTILPISNEKSIKINVSNELKHIMGEQPLIESLLINLSDWRAEKKKEHMIEQQEIYLSVKEKINIEKKDAVSIFLKYNNYLFNESPDTLDIKIIFSDFFAPEKYIWQLSLSLENNKKYYYCQIDAVTGQLSSLTRADYSGIQKPEYSTLLTKFRAGTLMNKKLDFYNNRIREVISNNPFNVKEIMIKNINLKDTHYIGFRPIAVIRADLSDGKAYEISFYTDTDEITSIDCT